MMKTLLMLLMMSLSLLLRGGIAQNAGEMRTQAFDAEPGWEGVNNRATTPELRPVKQDFGYSATARAGRGKGEIGGFITPDARPAYYAKRIPAKTLQDTLTASGTLAATGREFNVLVGFFNAGTINEWRTPNSLALRLYGRGDIFYAYVEYTTGRWRSGADSPGGFAVVRDPEGGRDGLRGFASNGAVHTWSLRYDPQGNNGGGSITVTMDDETSVCHLDAGHKADGATFNRFGLINVVKHADGGGEVWLDDIAVNGQTDRFDRDPRWEAFQNHSSYLSTDVRPRFDFGFSPTHYAGGRQAGELGGRTYRGDNRDAESLASYGDRLAPLTLEKPLRASGKVSLRRGLSDSTTLLGFYHSRQSLAVKPGQKTAFPACFLGIAIEGPSSEGFLFYPAYGARDDERGFSRAEVSPYILPDGQVHDWTLEYDPNAADGAGRITVTLDGKAVTLDLYKTHRATGADFDRFGLVTTWIDGNGQKVYFDDLRYTARQ